MNLNDWWWNLTETKRQLIQQPVHVVMAFALVALLQTFLPINFALVAAIGLLGWREYKQYPSTRDHDPVFDVTAQFIGLMLAQGVL